MNIRRRTNSRPGRRGFSYVEAMGALIILALGLTTGLNVFGSFARGSRIDADRVVAHQLCAGLMSEIQSRLFESGTYGAGNFGRGDWEIVRSDYDDVDDYDGWSASPPQGCDDKPLESFEDYTRSARVWNVNQDDFVTTAADGSTAVKAIEVQVTKDGKVLARLLGYRVRTP